MNLIFGGLYDFKNLYEGREPQKLLHLDILDNSVVGLMCGILFTLLVQSSSTTSSTVVGLVAGKRNIQILFICYALPF